MASWVNPWTGVVQAWPIAWLPLTSSAPGILGSRPGAAPQQSMVVQQAPAGTLPPALYQALTGLSLQSTPPSATDWVFDTGASTHMVGNSGMLSSTAPSTSRIIVGNGASLPVQCMGTATVPTSSSSPLYLRDVLFSPSLIKNLISVCRLTRDNSVSVEFDPLGFSIKDLRSKTVLLRSDSPGDLYPLRSAATPLVSGFHASVDLWHDRLGHPGRPALSRILNNFNFSCKPSSPHNCNSCRLGKHVRLPFTASSTVSPFLFSLLHCDIWTSPVLSCSGFQYYLVILDDYSHYVWTFPLRRKSDVVPTLLTFHAFVRAQFGRPILAFQTDNGREFDNTIFCSFLAAHGIVSPPRHNVFSSTSSTSSELSSRWT